MTAWRVFLNGKRKRADVILFQSRLMNNIFSLHRDISERTYVHGGYTAFNISDPKPRSIHKATVRDRLLHHLIYQELYRYFDSKFIFDSYSCRVEKGTHKAIDRFRDFGRVVSKNNTRTCFVLKCDIRKFFANIDHVILKEILAKHIEDEDILQLLGTVIDSFDTSEPPRFDYKTPLLSKGGEKARGLPLGNLTSQLLVNIYMNEFDHFMKREMKAKYYIRYADDFVILSEDKAYLENLLPKIAEFLETRLKLSLHPDKVFIKTLSSGVDFLGWIHFSHHRVLRTATKRRMWKRLVEMEGKMEVVHSYLGLLSHGNAVMLSNDIISTYATESLQKNHFLV